MLPTLFRIGHFSVSTYGVLVATAVLLGGWIAARGFQERGLNADAAWSLIAYGLIGGIVGAKIYYALLHGDASAMLSRGGLVWYGGLIGGIATAALFVRSKGLPPAITADALAPGLALGHGVGHIGCFFSGDSYGLPSSLPWAVAFPKGAPPSTAGVLRTEFGVDLPAGLPDNALVAVHPTMLYSSLALLAIFALLWKLRRKPFPAGWLFAFYLVLTGVERFLVEFLRAKDDRFLWGLTTAQAIAIAAILGGVALMLAVRSRGRRAAGVGVVPATP